MGIGQTDIAGVSTAVLAQSNGGEPTRPPAPGPRERDRMASPPPTEPMRPRPLPSSDLHSLVVDPRFPSTLYVGANIGVFVSRDDGAHWFSFQDYLPNATISQIFWDGGCLYATIHGRGLWRRRP
jgi:hypothetical protein